MAKVLTQEHKQRLAEGRRKAKAQRQARYKFHVGEVQISEYDYGFTLKISGSQNRYYASGHQAFESHALRDYLFLHGTETEKTAVKTEYERWKEAMG